MQILKSHRWREYGIPALLLAASIVTTTAIGARFMQNFLDGQPTVSVEGDLWPWPWLFEDPSRFLLGWPFSLALLAILLTHEFGHYFACRAHGIPSTLPWVLPAPTLSGTVGAVIQLKGRIPDRLALMDIGAYGPLAGYLASLIVIAIGFLRSHFPAIVPAHALIGFSSPLTMTLVHSALVPLRAGTPAFSQSLSHPVLVAGWVGLFITSLNLIPAGQLDGGHILYALSPKLHRILTWLLPAMLLIGGIFFWIGWLLWGLLLLIPVMRRHPYVSIALPLDRKRLWLSISAVAILLLTFSAAPFPGTSLLHYLPFLHWKA